jgi:predicted HicB family RNase H-like nuclease
VGSDTDTDTGTASTEGTTKTLYYAIPSELHRRLKMAAARRGCTIKALLIEAVERVVAEEDPA